jgi:predicted peptidase
MKPLLSAAAFVFCALSLLSWGEEKPAPGAQTPQNVEVTGEKGAKATVNYLLALPPASEAKPAGGYPLMLFMHGAGERGTDLNLVKKHGPPKLVGKNPELNKFIIVSPQCPAGQWWDITAMKGLIDHIAATQPVDKNRIVITGLSMGGYGTWAMLAKYPDLAAAAVPICGGGKPETAVRFKDVPIHCYHGAKDPTVPQKQSDDMIEALKKAGGKPEYTVFPDAAHDSWTAAYSDPKLFGWMLAQKKAAK